MKLEDFLSHIGQAGSIAAGNAQRHFVARVMEMLTWNEEDECYDLVSLPIKTRGEGPDSVPLLGFINEHPLELSKMTVRVEDRHRAG